MAANIHGGAWLPVEDISYATNLFLKLMTLTYEWNWNYDGTFDASGDTGSTQSHAWDEKGDYTVAVRVTDEDGSTSIATLDVTITDLGGPSAALTGDTPINEGATGYYDASGSTSPSGTITNYEWDWDYEGLFEASGDTGAIQTHVWPDNGVYTVAVRVTDDEGRTDIATLVVMVNNVNPTVSAGPDQTVTEGDTVNFSGGFTDPGEGDTHTISWDFGDGSPIVTGTLTPSHVYPTEGTYTVTLTVTDDDGGAGSDTLTVTVESGQVPPVQTIFNLTARAKLNKIQLTWSPVAGAQCYNVYRSITSGGPYTLVAGCHVTTYCTYLDEGLTIGTTYYYVVRSVTNGVESLSSNQASARPTLR